MSPLWRVVLCREGLHWIAILNWIFHFFGISGSLEMLFKPGIPSKCSILLPHILVGWGTVNGASSHPLLEALLEVLQLQGLFEGGEEENHESVAHIFSCVFSCGTILDHSLMRH